MQIYTVHTKSRPPSFVLEQEEMEPTVFVKEGFCWTAALFTVPWVCWHHMWRHTAMLLVAAVVLYLVFEGMDMAAPLRILVVLGALLIVGFEGNNWRREELEKQEYSLTAVVAAENRDAAIFRYLKKLRRTKRPAAA